MSMIINDDELNVTLQTLMNKGLMLIVTARIDRAHVLIDL